MNHVIQSVIFSKKYFTKDKAVKELENNDMYSYLEDIDNTYRARQINPEHIKSDSFKTWHGPKGIKFIIGILK